MNYILYSTIIFPKSSMNHLGVNLLYINTVRQNVKKKTEVRKKYWFNRLMPVYL